MSSELMLVLTYRPREDSESRGYNPWLREIDNPFFNSVKKVAHYSNWKLAPESSGVADWTHFDFMHIAKGVEPQEIFVQPDVAAFAAAWTRQWGRHPEAEDMSVNYEIHIVERLRQGQRARGGLVALILAPNLTNLPDSAEIWGTRNMVLGADQLGKEFAVVSLPYVDGTVDPNWGERILISECLAQP